MNAIRRFFHNLFQTMKKDNGAHFTYNLGVSFVRLGAVGIGGALIALLVFFFNIPDFLGDRGGITASVSDTQIVKEHHAGSRGGGFTVFRYFVTFSCTVGSTQMIIEERVPESEYSDYQSMIRNAPFAARLYYSQRSGLYVSRKGWLGAQIEYNSEHRRAGILSIFIYVLIPSMGLIGFGLNQERIAMKYPRTDVEVGGTDIVLADDEVDDLLKEFDEAYEKYKANKAAGLPTSEPPRRKKSRDDDDDGDDGGSERLLLEKKQQQDRP